MGGGGSQGSRTEAQSTYPTEFKPLAKAAADQIQAFQLLSPVSMFAATSPQRVAGISPFQQAGMNLIPNLLNPLPTLAQLRAFNAPIGYAASGAYAAGQQTPASRAGMQALINSGRVPSFDTVSPVQPVSPAAFQAGLPANIPSETALLSGMTVPQVAALQAQLARPIPTTVPVLGARPPDPLTAFNAGLIERLMASLRTAAEAQNRYAQLATTPVWGGGTQGWRVLPVPSHEHILSGEMTEADVPYHGHIVNEDGTVTGLPWS